MREARKLLDAFSSAANGYTRDDVIDAAANLVLNALRQEHQRLEEADEELRALADRMQKMLAQRHYNEIGQRRTGKIFLPDLIPIVRSLARN